MPTGCQPTTSALLQWAEPSLLRLDSLLLIEYDTKLSMITAVGVLENDCKPRLGHSLF